MNFKSFCSTDIVITDKEHMIQTLYSLEKKNVVLIMSESSVSRWEMGSFVDGLQQNIDRLDGHLTWIKKVPSNPTQRDILTALTQIGNHPIDVIIAFGGGSSIDLAKAISAFHQQYKDGLLTVDRITDGLKNKTYLNQAYPDIIALPTTAGTGSEVTQWATIWDENKQTKYSIDDPALKPKMAIIVPDLTLSMSAEMTLSTGLDAMSQAIESYWSKHTNPVVQGIAYRAVELSLQNLRKAVDAPQDLKVRENLCVASVLAGIAFSQTRTTACHSISYPLTMMYGVPHGLAVAMTLEAVGKLNEGHFPNDQAMFELFKNHGGIKQYINQVCEGVVTMTLSSFGITEKDFPIIVENAFTSGRMDNNPVDLNKEDVTKILRSVL